LYWLHIAAAAAAAAAAVNSSCCLSCRQCICVTAAKQLPRILLHSTSGCWLIIYHVNNINVTTAHLQPWPDKILICPWLSLLLLLLLPPAGWQGRVM
jgi:hypothetical protein